MLSKDPQYRLALDGVMRHAWTTGWNSNPLPTMASIGNEVRSAVYVSGQSACAILHDDTIMALHGIIGDNVYIRHLACQRHCKAHDDLGSLHLVLDALAYTGSFAMFNKGHLILASNHSQVWLMSDGSYFKDCNSRTSYTCAVGVLHINNCLDVQNSSWVANVSSSVYMLTGGCDLQKVSVDEKDVADAISDKDRLNMLPSVMPIFKVPMQLLEISCHMLMNLSEQ